MTELRLVSDRRRVARGGRRPNDRGGYAPMVVVVDHDSNRRDISEAILARLHFAVAPFDSVDKAISAMQALRPEVVVARADAAAELRGRMPADRRGHVIPLLSVTAELSAPDAMIDALRRLLRDAKQR